MTTEFDLCRNQNVTADQLSALVVFCEKHPKLVQGRYGRSTEGRSVAKGLWKELADILNTLSADCCRKTPDGWRQVS